MFSNETRRFKLRPDAFWIQQSFDGWLIEYGINHKNIKGRKGHKYCVTRSGYTVSQGKHGDVVVVIVW
jgi:hypothetical protein